MPLELWFAYVLTSAVVLAIPGPTVLLVLSYSIAHGRRATLPVRLPDSQLRVLFMNIVSVSYVELQRPLEDKRQN